MANQPSPMVPRASEQNPEGFSAPEKEPVLATPEEVISATPAHEQYDQASADVVREKLVSESAGLAPATQAQTSQATQTQTDPAKVNLSGMQPEDQVNHLVNLAHSSGLDHAFKVANATNNAYVIDRFHDELVNRVLHNKQQSM